MRTVKPTRYAELSYTEVIKDDWRVVYARDQQLPNVLATVGPHYKSEIELLCDLHRYAKESWGL